MPGAFVAVAKVSDIPAGQVKPVQVNGKRLLVCHVEGAAPPFYAIDDTCTHDDGPLGEGVLEGAAIECPRHGARFDVTTGRVLCLPAPMPIRSYPVRVEGDAIQVQA